MERIKLLDGAFDSTGRIMANVDPSSFGNPTPCADWDVRALINHTTSVVSRFERTAARLDPVTPLDDYIGNDAGASFAQAAEASLAAWSAPGAVEGMCVLPLGREVPAEVAAGLNAVDTLVHGWDLARATGQPAVLDPVLAEAALEIARAFLTEDMRVPGGPFAPAVPATPSASPSDALVSYLGRRP